VQEHGRVFSYAVIYIMNVLVIGLWMVLIGAPRFITFGDLLRGESVAAYNIAWQWMMLAWTWVAKLWESRA